MKILSILGWIIQALLGTMCLYGLANGNVSFAIILMFCLYMFAFIQERLEMYYTNILESNMR